MFVHIGIYNSKTSTQSHIYRKHIAGSIFVDKPLQNLEPFSNLLYLPRSQRSESFSFSELTFPWSNTSSQPFHQHCRQARGSSLDTYTIVKNFTAKNPEPRNLVASSNGGLVDSVATNHFAMLRLITFDGYWSLLTVKKWTRPGCFSSCIEKAAWDWDTVLAIETDLSRDATVCYERKPKKCC